MSTINNNGTHTNAKEAIRHSAEGYPLLGFCCYWSISEFRVTFAEFLKALEDLGISKDIANETQARTALQQAMDEVNEGRKGAFRRKIMDDKKETVFVNVASEVDQINRDVKFETETKAALDKDSKAVVIEGPNRQVIQEKYLQFRGTYTSNQFRTAILRFLRQYCDAITVRDRGGIYFVPSTKKEEFDRLEQLFSRFPGCSIDIIPVIDTAQAKKSIWKGLVGEVEEELNLMSEDMGKLDNDISERSLKLRVERYGKLREKIQDYEVLLTGTATDLKDRLADIQKKLEEKLVK